MSDVTTPVAESIPTARNFQAPLMVALYRLLHDSPDTTIKHSEVYPVILELMGIPSVDAHGSTAEGKPQVVQWVQWAFRNLKGSGKTQSGEGRGQWGLTEEGWAEARELTSTYAPPTQDEPAEEGVSSLVSPGHPEEGYHPDPYIRTLATRTQVTPCYGHYSLRSPLCGSCPLQGPCINFQAADFSRLAGVLLAEDRKGKPKPVGSPLPDPSPSPEPDPDPEPLPTSDLDFSQWGEALYTAIKVVTECAGCGQPITKGADAVWFRKNVDTKGRSAMLHWNCVPENRRPDRMA